MGIQKNHLNEHPKDMLKLMGKKIFTILYLSGIQLDSKNYMHFGANLDPSEGYKKNRKRLGFI